QADASTNVPAPFSEPALSSSVSTSTFHLAGASSGAVTGTVTLSDLTAVFTPSSPLSAGETYTATVTTGVTDLAGNPLQSEFKWSFTVAPPLDTTRPTVIATVPGNGATQVDAST